MSWGAVNAAAAAGATIIVPVVANQTSPAVVVVAAWDLGGTPTAGAVSDTRGNTYTRFVTLGGLAVYVSNNSKGILNTNWPAPGLDDTQLSKSGLPLELHRAQITDRRMSAFRVVEALDIVKHVCLCFIARPVRFVFGALGLQ
jgi:hypothetical protein